MRSIPTFSGKKTPVQASKSESGGLGCSAHGCPLVGTISKSTAGGNWLCWAHELTEEAHLWPEVTRGIEDNRWLFSVADRIAVMSSVELERNGKLEEINNYLASRNRKDLIRMKNNGEWSERIEMEPLPYWRMRLRHAAYAAATGRLDKAAA